MVSEGQKARKSLAGWFWLRASPKVAIKILAGAVALQGLTGTGGVNSKTAHSHGCCQEASGSQCEPVYKIAHDRPPTFLLEQVIPEREYKQAGSHNAF